MKSIYIRLSPTSKHNIGICLPHQLDVSNSTFRSARRRTRELRRLRREDPFTTTILQKRSGRVHIRRSWYRRIHILDDTGLHVALGDSRRHEYRKIRMAGTEESVLGMFRWPSQSPNPPWLSYFQCVKLIKPVRTDGHPGVSYKRIIRHSWFELELRVDDMRRSTRL